MARRRRPLGRLAGLSGRVPSLGIDWTAMQCPPGITAQSRQDSAYLGLSVPIHVLRGSEANIMLSKLANNLWKFCVLLLRRVPVGTRYDPKHQRLTAHGSGARAPVGARAYHLETIHKANQEWSCQCRCRRRNWLGPHGQYGILQGWSMQLESVPGRRPDRDRHLGPLPGHQQPNRIAARPLHSEIESLVVRFALPAR